MVLDTGSGHTLPYDRINRMQCTNYCILTIEIILHLRDEKSKTFILYAVQSLKRGD